MSAKRIRNELLESAVTFEVFSPQYGMRGPDYEPIEEWLIERGYHSICWSKFSLEPEGDSYRRVLQVICPSFAPSAIGQRNRLVFAERLAGVFSAHRF